MTSGFISTSIAAKLLGKTDRHVRNMCDAGRFKTARKLGISDRAWWEISSEEIHLFKMKPHSNRQYA